MIVEREDNSALYFIVGGLLVAAMVFAIFYFQGGRGTDTVTERQTIVEKAAPNNPSSSTSISVDGDGVRATTTDTQP